MSWMQDEWKEGLPQKSLIKINEIEGQVERLKKERDQKQFQLESLEQALEVQKRKGSNERLELSELKRETKYLSEKCEEWEKKVQKLTAELSVKDKQASALEEKYSKAITASQQSERTSSSQATVTHIEQIKSLENEIQNLKQQLDKKVTPLLATSGTSLVEEPKYSRNSKDTERMALQSQIQDLENRNKKLIQDGDCMRHNSEAARKHLELKMKEKEKEHNLELAQALESAKQCNNQLHESKIKFQQDINLAQAEQNRLKGLLEKAEAEKSKMNEKNLKISEMEKNVQSLNDQLHSLKQEHNKLQKSSTEKINQIEAALKKKSEELDKVLVNTGLEVDQTQKKFEEISKRGEVLEKELQACQAKCEKGQQVITSLETQVSSLKKELQSKESCVSNVNLTLENVNQELQMKVKEIMELKGKLEQQEAHLAGLNSKLTVAEKSMEEINTTLKDTGSRLKTKEDKVVELEKKITFLQNGRSDLESVLATLKEDIQTKLVTISSLEKESASLKEDLEAANIKQKETEQFLKVNQENMLLLENRLGQVEEQKTALETSLNKELETLQQNKNHLLEELNHKSSAMLDLENVNGDLLFKLKTSQEKLSELSIEHEKEVALLKSQQEILQKNFEEKDNQLKIATTQVTNLQSQLNSLKEDMTLLRDASISKETEISQLRTDLEAARTMIVDKDSEMDDLKLANLNLESVITETKVLLEKKDFGLNQMIHDCELSAVKIQKYEEKFNHYETIKVELTNVIGTLQANITAEKELTQLKLSEIETLNLQCASLTDQLNTAKSVMVTMQSEVDCSILNHKHLEAKQQELEQEKLNLEKSLTIQMESLNQELKDMNKAVAEKDCLIQELQSCKEDLKAKLTAIKEDLLKDETQHDQVLTTLKSKFELLQMDLEDKDREIDELKNEISNLKSQLAKVKQDKDIINETLKSRELDLTDIKQILNLEQDKYMAAELMQKNVQDEKFHLEQVLKTVREELDKLMGKTALEAEQNEKKFEDFSNREKALQCEFNACQAKCEKGQQVITSLETQVSSLKKELQSKESCVSNVNLTLENVNQELQMKVKEIMELKGKLEQQEAHLAGLNSKLTVAEKSMEEINTALKDTGSRLKTKEDKVVELEKKITFLQNGRSDLESVLATLKEDIQTKLVTISSLEKESASLKEDLEAANIKQKETEQFLKVNQENMLLLENRLGQVEEQKTALETSLNKELETLQQNKNHLLEELNHKSSTMLDLENVNGDLLFKLKTSQEKLCELSIEHEKEVALLKSQQEILQKNFEEKDNQLKIATTQVTNLQSQLNSLKEDMTLLRDASISKETEISQLRTDLEAARTMIVDKDSEMDDLKLANLNLESVITETKVLLEKKDFGLNQMIHDCELSAVKIQEYEEKFNHYETIKVELTNVIGTLQANITAEKELTQLKLSEIETLNLQCASLTDQLNTAKSMMVTMQSEVDCSILNHKHLEAKQQELEQEKLNLEKSLTIQMESLNQELKDMNKAVAEKDCLIQELQSCKEDLKAKLTAIKEDLLKDETQHDQVLTTLKSKFELLQMDLEDKDREIDELKNEISNLKSQLAKVKQDKDIINETLKSRELDLTDIKQILNLEQDKYMAAELMQKNVQDEKFHLEQVLKTVREELDCKESDLTKQRHICEDYCEKIKLYEDKVHVLEHIKDKITQKLSDLEEALDTEKITCAAKSLEIENLNHNFATLSDNLDVMNRSCQEKLEEIKALRHNCLQLELKCKQLELEKQECNEAVTANKSETYQELFRENEKNMQELGELRKTLTDLQSKIDQLTSTVQSHEKHIYSLESQLTEAIQVKKDYQSELSKLTTELSHVESVRKALENKIKHLEQEKSSAEKNLCWNFEQTKHKLNTVEEELGEKSVALEAMQAQYDNMNRSVLKANSKIADLQEEKKTITDELLEITKALEDVKTDLSEKNATVLVLREELENTVLENESLRSDKSELLSQEEKWKLAIHELEIKLADVESEIESTKESFESVSVQRFESQKKLSACLREKDELEKSLKELEIELVSANSEIERLNSVVSEMDSLKREILMKADVISDLKLKNDDLSKKNQALSFEIETIQKEKMDLQEQLDSVMSRIEQFQEDREEVSRDTGALRSQLLMLQKAIESQTSSLDSKQKEVVEKANELLIKKNEISLLQQTLEENNKEIHQLKKENLTLKKEIKDLNSNVGTLQDAIESLNYDLNLTEQDKTAVLSDATALKCENNELKEKLSKITSDLEHIKTYQSANNQVLEMLEKDKINLENSLESLRIKNKDLGLELENVCTNEANLKIKLTALQENLDVNISNYASLQQELISALSERELACKDLQSCQNVLSRAQVNEKDLTLRIEELNYHIISMTSDIETKDFKIENLQKEIDKLRLENEDTERIGNNQLMEEQKKMKLVEKEKAELNQRLTDLESELYKMKIFEEKACLYESLLIEKNQMKEKILQLQLVEKEIKNLKLSLIDKEADLLSVTDNKTLLESNILDLQEEIKNHKDLIRVKDQQLVVTQQEKLSVEAKLQELLEVAAENVKLKAHVQDLEITLKSDKEMIENLKAKYLTKESISGESNNDKTKWERKYSDQEDKIKMLEKELEKLKEEHVSRETIESLKAELEEAQTDVEFFSDAAYESREKLNELTKNNKELLCKNDILKIKLKIFRDLLNKHNIPINCDSHPQEREIPPVPHADFTKVKQETNTTIKNMTGPSHCALKLVPEILTPSGTDHGSKTSKISSTSSLTKETNTKKALQSEPAKRMPAPVGLSPQCSSPSMSQKKLSKMTPSSIDKKTPLVFKSPSAKLAASLDKKSQFVSKLASPKPKLIATASKAPPAAACYKFAPNEQASCSDVAKGSESAPQESTLTNGARRIPVGNAIKDTDLPKVLSPRKTRRSTQKRQSTDPTEEIAGGKKLKLATEKPPKESLSTQKQVLKPQKFRANSLTGIPKVSVPRPIKEAKPSPFALATITNSPKKLDRNIKESLRPRGLSKIMQPGTLQTGPQITEEPDSKPDECKSQ